jgi:hypothetical protein
LLEKVNLLSFDGHHRTLAVAGAFLSCTYSFMLKNRNLMAYDRRQKLVILSISTEKPMLKEVPVVNGEK